MAQLPTETEILPAPTPAPEEVPAKRTWRKLLPHLLVLLLYTLLSMYYLAPLIARFWQDVPFGGDSWIFYWDLWWVKKAVVDLHTNPFFTTYVNFPGGASLYFHTLAFLDGVIAIPLQLLGMSLAGAFNTIVLFGYMFSAYGMFLLADYLVKHKPAAFVAGLVFGFSPFHFAHLNGQLNFVSIQWMPFYLLFLLKALETAPEISRRTRWTNVGLASLFLALNALTEWTLAAFLVMLSFLYLLYRLWWARRDWKVFILGPVLRLGAVLVLFGVLTAPVLIPMLNEIRSNKSVTLDPQESVLYSADLLSFVTPYELHPVLGKFSSPIAQQFTGNPAERTTYLGLIALILAACGVWFFWRKGAGFWLLSLVCFVVLALGPELHIGGRSTFTVFKLTVPLPYALLYQLPFFSIMRTPARFVLVALLALSVLVAFGVKALSERLNVWLAKRSQKTWTGRASWGLVGLVSLLIACEFAPYVATAYPNVPNLYAPIVADQDSSKAVLELPLRQASHFYIAQVAYQKPMIGGYLARPVENPLIAQVPALETLALRNTTPTGTVAQLQAANIRYVIVNWWMLNDDEKTRMTAALQQVFGRPPDSQEMEPDGSKVRLSLYIL